MADLGNLTNLVAQLTNRLNDIETNAKKIDELPPKSEITLSDKLHISDNGVSKYTTMGDVINSIKSRDYDHLVSVESVTNVGNDVIITNAVAEINGNNVTNGTPVTLFVPYAAAGYHRIDHILIDADGQIYLYQGNETTGIAIEPAYVLGTVLITELDVSDNSIITGEPVIGDDFIKRSEQIFIQANIINSIINLANITESDKRYTNIKIMSGGSLSKVTYNFAYEGMRSLIWNATNANIQIVSGQTFMQNVTITPNQIIEFIYSGGKLYLEGGVGGTAEKRTFTKEMNIAVVGTAAGTTPVYMAAKAPYWFSFETTTNQTVGANLVSYLAGDYTFFFEKSVKIKRVISRLNNSGVAHKIAIIKGDNVNVGTGNKSFLLELTSAGSTQVIDYQPTNGEVISAGSFIKIFYNSAINGASYGSLFMVFEEI